MKTFNQFQEASTELNESRAVKDIQNSLLAIQKLFKHDYKQESDITMMDWYELTPAQQAELQKAAKIVWQYLDY